MPKATFVHQGDFIEHIPTTALAAGDVVVQRDLIGIAVRPIPAGQLGALGVTGVFDVPVEDVGSWLVGQLAYWDPVDQRADPSSSGLKLLGKVVAIDPRPGQSLVRVRLSP